MNKNVSKQPMHPIGSRFKRQQMYYGPRNLMLSFDEQVMGNFNLSLCCLWSASL